MIVYSLLTATLLLAVLSLYLAGRCCSHRRIVMYDRLLLSLTMALFIYLFGTWVFLSVYLRYVFAAAYLLSLLYATAGTKQPVKRHTIRIGVNLMLASVFAVLSVLYFTGTAGKPYGVAHLSMPFRHGRYFVFQGGRGLPGNVFHYKLRTAVFAMDIVKLNSRGNRAKHIFSTHLPDYELYGDTLLSPCSGRVARTADDNPDNIPPSMKRGATNTNHVLIQNDSIYVFLGHLKPGCLFVHEGDSVVAGQPIACCGNSGFSLEPHLHIQVHARTGSGLPWYREPQLLIEFKNRFL